MDSVPLKVVTWQCCIFMERWKFHVILLQIFPLVTKPYLGNLFQLKVLSLPKTQFRRSGTKCKFVPISQRLAKIVTQVHLGFFFPLKALNTRALKEFLPSVLLGNLALPGLCQSHRHSSFYLWSFQGKDTGWQADAQPPCHPRHVLYDALWKLASSSAQAWGQDV